MKLDVEKTHRVHMLYGGTTIMQVLFTCFTGTKVQILVQKYNRILTQKAHALRCHRQYADALNLLALQVHEYKC